MSRITLSGNASGTGNFTLASPNSNTDRTLTLPDATGTVVYADANGKIIGTKSVVAIGPGDGNDFKNGGTFMTFVTFPYDVTITSIIYQYLQGAQDNVVEQFGYVIGGGSFVALDTYTGTAAGTRSQTKTVSLSVTAGTKFYVGPNSSQNANQTRIIVSLHYSSV
jgi:hypothetical protein